MDVDIPATGTDLAEAVPGEGCTTAKPGQIYATCRQRDLGQMYAHHQSALIVSGNSIRCGSSHNSHIVVEVGAPH